MSTALRSIVTAVLGSQSPDRFHLLTQIGINVRRIVSDFEENLPKTLPPAEFVEKTALGKLENVLEKLAASNDTEYDVVICSDTVIWFENEIIGKPVNAEDAVATLKRMSGGRHAVFSGVALAFRDGSRCVLHERSTVQFRHLEPETIQRYVATGEPLSRAGSYGIQGRGATLVSFIEGCYSNIVGLPLGKLAAKLEEKKLFCF